MAGFLVYVAGIAVSLLILVNTANLAIHVFAIYLLVLSVNDCIVNMLPDKSPIIESESMLLHNDGNDIFEILKNRQYEKLEYEIREKIVAKKYTESIIYINLLIQQKHKPIENYRFLIYCHLQSGSFNKALTELNNLEKLEELTTEELSTRAWVKTNLKLYNESLEDYEKCILKNPKNISALSNYGFTLNILKKYSRAIEIYSQVISINSKDDQAWNNRGMAKIDQGHFEEGLKDIRQALKLNEYNPFAYTNLAVYAMKQTDFLSSLEYLRIAMTLSQFEEDKLLINKLIEQVQGMLESSLSEN